MRYKPNELTIARVTPGYLSNEKAQSPAARAAGIEFLRDFQGVYHFVSPEYHYRIFSFSPQAYTAGPRSYLVTWQYLKDCGRGRCADITASVLCDPDLESAQDRVLYLMNEEEFPSAKHADAWRKFMSDRGAAHA